MKRIILALGLALTAFIGTDARASAPPLEYGHCMSIAPICAPGAHPTCICESDISMSCTWICAGR